MRNRWIGAAAMVIAAGCGGGGSGGTNNNTGGATALQCNYPAQSMCLTVRAPAFTAAQTTALQNECTTDGGTYGTGACPTTNAVAGTCTVTNPANLPATTVTGMVVTASFYTPTFNATTAAAACGAMGTWAGGGGGGGGGTVVSCNFGNVICAQNNGPFDAAMISAVQASCTQNSGTFAQAACSSAGALGSCYYAPDQSGFSERIYYYSSFGTLAEAQADCATPPAGVWQ